MKKFFVVSAFLVSASSALVHAREVEDVDVFGKPNPLPIYQETACDSSKSAYICLKRDFYVQSQKVWVPVELPLLANFEPVSVVESGNVNWWTDNPEVQQRYSSVLAAYDSFKIDRLAVGSGSPLARPETDDLTAPGDQLFTARVTVEFKAKRLLSQRQYYVLGKFNAQKIKILGISDYTNSSASLGRLAQTDAVVLQVLKAMWKRDAFPDNDSNTLDKYLRRSGAVVTAPVLDSKLPQ